MENNIEEQGADLAVVNTALELESQAQIPFLLRIVTLRKWPNLPEKQVPVCAECNSILHTHPR